MGFGLLDSVDKSSAAHIISGQHVASLHAGWAEIPRRSVGGLVSHNETLCACVKMQTKSSVLVAQSVGSCAWLVARKDASHPGHAAILWRGVKWWEIMKSTGAGSRDQTWRHRRKNWVRSFQHGLSRILGMNWWEVANLGRSSWKAGKCEFIHDAVRCWGGPRPLWKKAFLDNLVPIMDVGVI